MFLPLYCVSFGLRLLIIPSSFSCLYVLAILLCVLRFTASDYPFKLFLSLCSCHCIVCPSVYGFWLPLQTFLVFMFFPLHCVTFDLRLLIIPSSFSLSLCSCHCIVYPSVYGFWLSLQAFLCLYVLAIVLCVLRFTASDYPFNLFLSLCSYHCIVCPSVYGFWLPFQTFLVFMFLPLYCVSFGLRILITPSSFSLSVCSCHCIVCPSVYGFWLLLQTFLVFMFLPLYCVSFGLRLLITPSSFSLSLCSCNCIVGSSVYGFWLSLQAFLCLYVLAIVLCVLRFTASDYPFKLFLSLCSCHCIVCPSVYGFWLPLQAFLCLYVLTIVLCVLRFTASDYPFKLFFVFMFLPLYCVSFGLRLLITPSNFSCLYVLVIVLCVLRFTASDYPFNLFLSLCSCHCIVCSSVYGFWLPLQTFLVFMLLPLYCVSFGLRLLITPSSFSCLYVLAIVLCVLRCTASDYPFKLFLSLCSYHCIVCHSVYGFWLPLQTFLVFMFFPLYCVSFGLRLLITPSSFSCLYVLTIVLCVLRFTASDYPFKLFLSLCSSHCIVCPSVYGFWLPLQAFLCLYVLAIVLCVLRCTASDYPFKLFLSLCSYHCIVCPSVYGFWLPLQAFLVFMFLPLYCVSFGLRLLITPSSFSCLYVLAIVLCVLRFTASDYPFKLFLSLCSYHCIVCPSVYGFWLPLEAFLVFMFFPLYCVSFALRLLITPLSFSCLYVLAIVLCVLRFTASDYPFKLFLSLCSCHCIVCPSLYGFWLPL